MINIYKRQEDRLQVAKLIDKIQISNRQNKIVHTNFLDLYQKKLVENVLKKIGKENVEFLGGFKQAERTICILYPEKCKKISQEILIKEIIDVVRVKLSKENYGKYAHNNYLGALMKIGLQREKIGVILVEENGADIIVMKEISQYVKDNLSQLTRFSKSQIEIISLENLRKVEIKKQEFKINVSSLRLDNIVSELSNTSRKKTEEILAQERVFINFEVQTKNTKQVKQGDKITIRGKGRFEIKEIIGKTRSGRIVVVVEKYV